MTIIKEIYTSNTLTLARSLLALCFLTTLIFTPVYDLFPVQHIVELKSDFNGLSKLNIYLWFDNINIHYYISIVILILVISGVYPRLSCLLQTWVSYSIFYSMLVNDGGDQINVILNFLLLPVCLLDNRKNGWHIVSKRKVTSNQFLLCNASFALVFIQIQMAVLYFNASVAKMFAPEWLNGTAVYYWFNDPTFGAPYWLKKSVGFLFENDYTITIITWYVMILEIALFVGLFLKQKYKYLLFVLAFIFHFLIFIVHGLPSFCLSMTGGLILFYFHLDQTIVQIF
ncbi:sporulation-delaying protein SdpB family protein, partial [Flavobacterium sp. HTF]|uniref:sporulation-delaying protein SdpB family protein n=1 Tax=Flavobacterium sp. HTF TaxID=2170732 RepID=UPI000D5CE9AD